MFINILSKSKRQRVGEGGLLTSNWTITVKVSFVFKSYGRNLGIFQYIRLFNRVWLALTHNIQDCNINYCRK